MKNKEKERNCIVLCSGGIDSVVTAHYAKRKLKYKSIIALFFDYGQKALKQERICSKRCAKNLSAKFAEVELKWLNDIPSSLINKKGRTARLKIKDLKNTKKESQKWYVPCRNTLFLAYALALAESFFIKKKKVYDIFVGFKCEGKEAYPDTTPGFVKEI
ncbi:7-cyano-7-deazaguanine synthase, partial [Candidatus Pacearchaeota archaeon]|nr:7-cyano-7-deazaguanine synthase [Candidatus Pacearchaeota archaeon]